MKTDAFWDLFEFYDSKKQAQFCNVHNDSTLAMIIIRSENGCIAFSSDAHLCVLKGILTLSWLSIHHVRVWAHR